MRYSYERGEETRYHKMKERADMLRVFTTAALLLLVSASCYLLLTVSSSCGSVPVSARNDGVEQCINSHSCTTAQEETVDDLVSVGGYTIEVNGLSLKATKEDVYEFFSFAGEIEHVQILRIGEHGCTAYVTFEEAEARMTAVSLSGTTILDKRVCIARWGRYEDEFDVRGRDSSSVRDEQELKSDQNAAIIYESDINAATTYELKSADADPQSDINASTIYELKNDQNAVITIYEVGIGGLNKAFEMAHKEFLRYSRVVIRAAKVVEDFFRNLAKV